MTPYSSTLAWKIPWMEKPGGLQSMGSLESDTTERLPFHFSLSCIGEGNDNPLQCSCLDNPRDLGAWWAAVYGVAQSRTRLKRLSSSSSKHQWWLRINLRYPLKANLLKDSFTFTMFVQWYLTDICSLLQIKWQIPFNVIESRIELSDHAQSYTF